MKKLFQRFFSRSQFDRIIPGREMSDNIHFMSEIDAATHRTGSKFAYLTSFVIFLLLVLTVLWARQAVMDEVTRGIGQVIPSQRVQVIQNLEGGILEAILVDENQIVNQGDILLRIHNTISSSQYRDAVSKAQEHRAAIIRLNAEIKGTKLVFPDDTEIPGQTVNVQNDIYEARRQQLQSELNVLGIAIATAAAGND